MPDKKNRSIHVYLNDAEYERVIRVIEGLRTLGKGARIQKGDAAAALIMIAIDDEDVLRRARKYMTSEDKGK